MYPYFKKTKITRLVTRREAGDDNELYMGYNHCTDCKTCDGTGYVIEVKPGQYLPVFGDETSIQADSGLAIQGCPNCNPHNVTPRNSCCMCSHSGTNGYLVLGNKYTGSRMSYREGRLVVFNGYLCDQCAGSIEFDGGKLS